MQIKMPSLLKNGISFFVYSNLFLAFCATAYTAKTSLLLYSDNGNLHVNSMVFFATLFLYCFHRINKKKSLAGDEGLEERNGWVVTHKAVFYALIIISLLFMLIELRYMPVRTWLVFIPVGLLGMGYTFPLIPTAKGWKRLRDLYWLKTFWIAFAFCWLTTFLPVVYRESLTATTKPEVLFIFIRSLLFLFAMCIPFDIRDMHFDRMKGVSTLPVRLGAKDSVKVGSLLLLLFIVLVIIELFYNYVAMRPAMGLLFSAGIGIILLQLAKNKQPALLFSVLYDGALFTQWLFIWLCMHIA